MRILKASAGTPQCTAAVQQAAEALRDGGLVAFPTDTVYGVAVTAFNARAVQRLFVAKGRSSEKAIPVLLARAHDLNRVAASIPPLAADLAERFWPGPLTLVLRRHPALPAVLVAGGDR